MNNHILIHNKINNCNLMKTIKRWDTSSINSNSIIFTNAIPDSFVESHGDKNAFFQFIYNKVKPCYFKQGIPQKSWMS